MCTAIAVIILPSCKFSKSAKFSALVYHACMHADPKAVSEVRSYELQGGSSGDCGGCWLSQGMHLQPIAEGL